MSDALRLDDRTVIVTGASRGIGATVAELISGQGGGVVLVARTEADLAAVAERMEGPVETVVGDVSDPAVADAAVRAASGLPGSLWGLVNNAGINPHYHPATETPVEEWDQVVQVNLLGAAAFARAVGASLAQSGAGRIVNVSSIAALTGLPNIVAYNATKAGLDAMTRTMAVELGPAGVLVNSVAPGTISTEMVADLLEANAALREKLIAKTPLGRVGAPAEAAWPIVFLLTDAASFITGQVLTVDGGRLAAG